MNNDSKTWLIPLSLTIYILAILGRIFIPIIITSSNGDIEKIIILFSFIGFGFLALIAIGIIWGVYILVRALNKNSQKKMTDIESKKGNKN